MEFGNINNDNFQEISIKNEKFLNFKSIEDLYYLYPNGHRTTNQMRWFKGSRDRGFRSDVQV